MKLLRCTFLERLFVRRFRFRWNTPRRKFRLPRAWCRIERTMRGDRPKPGRVTPRRLKSFRYQLNLTPKSKTMFDELMKHVQTFSPEGDTRTSEVFQGVIGILHSAMDKLELAELPRRGAWGSVTAKNFPNA